MKEYAAGIQSSELRLVDTARAKPSEPDAPAPAIERANNGTVSPRNGSVDTRAAIAPYNRAAPSASASPPSAKVPDESGTPAIDKFLGAATKEFEAGIVDHLLWRRATGQAGGDRTLATQNYLRARATALQVAKREKRHERLARRARALTELAPDAGRGVPTLVDAGRPSPPPPRRVATTKRLRVIGLGGTLAALFVIAFFVAVRSESDAARAVAIAKSPTPARSSGTNAARPASAAGAQTRKRDDAPLEDWAGKLEKLKSEGNWNVIVLYAGEWARAQPDNASAWKELAAGYVKLRQYRDALDAANRVVKLAPDDAAAWRSLGQVNAALRQPAEALAAFEQAVARDDHDAASVVQVGTLATQLGRFSDARAAFAKVLALNPVDVDALCGAASLAQKEQRAKDAEALTRQIASLDARCRDTEGESVRVAAGDKTRPAASPR